MKANELRIGNYVTHKDSPNWFPQLDIELLREITEEYHEFKPIPLTEEWLLKFGFKRCENGDADLGKCYSSPNVSLLMWYGQDRADVSFWQGHGFKYVHQLQNLYFALTNKELTL